VLGVLNGAEQLGSFDANDLNNAKIDMTDVRKTLARDFVSTFNSLLSVMRTQEIKQRAKLAKQASQAMSVSVSSGSTVTNLKRTADSITIDVPPKRTKITANSLSPEPLTPDRPTRPANAYKSVDSMDSSTSKDEESTKKLLSAFLENTMSVLEGEFITPQWQKSGNRVELVLTLHPHIDASNQQCQRFD
jgi:hypothetical protein